MRYLWVVFIYCLGLLSNFKSATGELVMIARAVTMANA